MGSLTSSPLPVNRGLFEGPSVLSVLKEKKKSVSKSCKIFRILLEHKILATTYHITVGIIQILMRYSKEKAGSFLCN